MEIILILIFILMLILLLISTTLEIVWELIKLAWSFRLIRWACSLYIIYKICEFVYYVILKKKD